MCHCPLAMGDMDGIAQPVVPIPPDDPGKPEGSVPLGCNPHVAYRSGAKGPEIPPNDSHVGPPGGVGGKLGSQCQHGPLVPCHDQQTCRILVETVDKAGIGRPAP